MIRKINCIYFKNGGYCSNEKVKKSFFGIGARLCSEHFDVQCDIQEKSPKQAAPPPPMKRINDANDYWRTRCELAEKYIEESPGDPDIYPEQLEAYHKWRMFKGPK